MRPLYLLPGGTPPSTAQAMWVCLMAKILGKSWNFLGLENAGIELDGNQILVNERYQTNDPDVYAAGSFIKMRITPNYQYKFVSERELARKVKKASFNSFYNVQFRSPITFRSYIIWALLRTRISRIDSPNLCSSKPFFRCGTSSQKWPCLGDTSFPKCLS